MDYRKEYECWMKQAAMDEDIVEELRSMDDAKMEDAFYRDLAFGTGGLRGVIGAGTNRINIYTIAKASQGLADYLKKNFEEPSVAIGYDSRIKSDVFARTAAGVFAANGVRVSMRKSIDGLCAIIQDQFSMEIDHALYLFCGRKCDRIKAILKEPDGIVMIYKRLTAQGSYRWPRDKSEVWNLTWREFDWLMSGIDIEQPKAIRTSCARQ